MSVIAAKVLKDKVVLAADSILVHGWSKRNDTFSKIVSANDMIIGGTGIAEECSLMWHYMETHKPSGYSEKDILNFIVEFAKWKKDFDGSSTISNSYLMAYCGHLFEISRMFVHEINNFHAVGAGEDFANAALYLGHSPEEAVKVACELSCFVCEPIISFSQNKSTV